MKAVSASCFRIRHSFEGSVRLYISLTTSVAAQRDAAVAAERTRYARIEEELCYAGMAQHSSHTPA